MRSARGAMKLEMTQCPGVQITKSSLSDEVVGANYIEEKSLKCCEIAAAKLESHSF